MNALTEVIASFRKRAQDLEKMAADLERLAVNERITITALPGSNPVVSANLIQPVRPVVNTNPNSPQDIPKPPAKKRENKTGRVLTHRGLRANVLRYLITGEATAVTVANILAVPYNKVKGVMINLVHEGFATKEIRSVGAAGNARKYEVFVLTTAGRSEAKWYVDNPDLMIRNKQAVNNANKRNTPGTEARPN